MLHVNYIPDFQAGQPMLVVTGDAHAFSNAAEYLRNRQGASLMDTAIAEYPDLGPLQPSMLNLSPSECNSMADRCLDIVESTRPCHIYMDLAALPNVEVVLSYGEYKI